MAESSSASAKSLSRPRSAADSRRKRLGRVAATLAPLQQGAAAEVVALLPAAAAAAAVVVVVAAVVMEIEIIL